MLTAPWEFPTIMKTLCQSLKKNQHGCHFGSPSVWLMMSVCPVYSSGGQTPRRDLEKQLTGEEKWVKLSSDCLFMHVCNTVVLQQSAETRWPWILCQGSGPNALQQGLCGPAQVECGNGLEQGEDV